MRRDELCRTGYSGSGFCPHNSKTYVSIARNLLTSAVIIGVGTEIVKRGDGYPFVATGHLTSSTVVQYEQIIGQGFHQSRHLPRPRRKKYFLNAVELCTQNTIIIVINQLNA